MIVYRYIIKPFLLILFLLSIDSIIAEEEISLTEDIQFELLLEQIARDYGQSVDADLIEYYHERKIRRTEGNIEKIASLPFIDRATAFAIVSNPNKSIDELTEILLLSRIQADILRFTLMPIKSKEKTIEESKLSEVVEDSEEFTADYRLRGRHEFEEKRGFQTGNYLGDPNDYYQRLTLGYGDFQGSIITSKDAGETSYTDFISGGLEYSGEYGNLIIGDYIREWGQGGMTWRLFGSRKGGETVSAPFRSSNRSRLNTSSIPEGVLRGASADSDIAIDSNSYLKLSSWYSNQLLDANLTDKQDISSIVNTGFRRTQNDLDRSNALQEELFGASAEYVFSNSSLGLAYQSIKYDHPLNTSSSKYFIGEKNDFLSMIGEFELSDGFRSNTELVFSGLTSGSGNSEYTILSSLQYKSRNHRYVLHFRSLSDKYLNPYANPFSEFSGTADETGLYIGYLLKVSEKTNISTFLDLFQSSSPRTTSNMPVNGWDWLSQISYRPAKSTEIIIRGRLESRFDKVNLGDGLPIDNEYYRISGRADIIKKVNRNNRLRLRGEYSAFDPLSYGDVSQGYLVSFDWDSDLLEWLRFGFRHTIYSTDGFESAMWQYEYVFAGYSTAPVLFGQGSRTTLELSFDPLEGMRLSGRYALDTKRGDEPFGSGNETINGNQRSNIIFQVDYNL